MAELTKKQQRIIQRALKSLFQLKSFVIPKSIKDLPMKDPLSREVRLADNRRIYLSDEGIASIKTIVGTIEDGNLFDGLADYGEIWTACWRILEGALSGGREPETSSDLLEMDGARARERENRGAHILGFAIRCNAQWHRQYNPRIDHDNPVATAMHRECGHRTQTCEA